MKAAALASLTRRQLETPTTRWILLAFTAFFMAVKVYGYVALKWNHPATWASAVLTPCLIAFCYCTASQWPWFWTGDERLRPAWWRGALQAVPFNAFLILLMVSFDFGLLRLAGIQGVPIEGSGRVYGYWHILKVQTTFSVPILTIVGALVMLGQITRMEKEEAEARAKEAQWVLLRGQLSPHVLFNSLNGLAELVLPWAPSVNNLYRTIIRGKGKRARAIPIKSEEHRLYMEAVDRSFDDVLEVTLEER